MENSNMGIVCKRYTIKAYSPISVVCRLEASLKGAAVSASSRLQKKWF
jgi:hypothetical protein